MARPKRADPATASDLDFLVEAHARVIGEQEGTDRARTIAAIRDLARRLRARYASADERKLVRRLRAMKVEELLEVARAFTVFFFAIAAPICRVETASTPPSANSDSAASISAVRVAAPRGSLRLREACVTSIGIPARRHHWHRRN